MEVRVFETKAEMARAAAERAGRAIADAIARSVGLVAHSMEQVSVGKVIRPRGRYTGPALEIPTTSRGRSPARSRPAAPPIR